VDPRPSLKKLFQQWREGFGDQDPTVVAKDGVNLAGFFSSPSLCFLRRSGGGRDAGCGVPGLRGQGRVGGKPPVLLLRPGFSHARRGRPPLRPCQTDPPPFTRARAAALYDEEGPSGQAIKRFKYNRRLDMLPVMHHWLKRPLCLELVQVADLVAPVPLHPSRLRQRGFNQALLLAQAFPEVPLERELLARQRHTPPQAGLNPKERRDNVKGAFAVPRPELVKGKSILLIDDVFTTGATVRECAKVLRRAGAREVNVLTVARVRYE
jgi:ComF family protein